MADAGPDPVAAEQAAAAAAAAAAASDDESSSVGSGGDDFAASDDGVDVDGDAQAAGGDAQMADAEHEEDAAAAAAAPATSDHDEADEVPPAKRRREGEGSDHAAEEVPAAAAAGAAAAPAAEVGHTDMYDGVRKLPSGEFDLRLEDGRLVSRGDLESVIVQSLLGIDTLEFVGFEGAHVKGLENNIVEQARKQQLEEIKRLNAESDKKEIFTVEREAEVPNAKLLSHLDVREAALKQAKQELYPEKARKQADKDKQPQDVAKSNPVVLAAFGYMSEVYTTLHAEGDHPMRHGAAILSRLVTTLDGPSHTILNKLLATCVEKAAASDLSASLTFALQLLYSAYASTAPMSLAEDPRLGQDDFDTVTATPDCALSITKPLDWLRQESANGNGTSGGGFAFAADGEGSAYHLVFEKVLAALRPHWVRELSPKKLLLSEVLRECPSIPAGVWDTLHTQCCLSDDPMRIWAAMRSLYELVDGRPAARQRALSYFLHYSVCSRAQTRACAINFLMYDVLPLDITFKTTVTDFVLGSLDNAMAVDGAKASTEELEDCVAHTLPLYCALCLVQPDLLDRLFKVVAECKKAGRVRHLRSIFAHKDLEKAIKKIGVVPALAVVEKHHDSPLSLHILRLLVHQLKGELNAQVQRRSAETDKGPVAGSPAAPSKEEQQRLADVDVTDSVQMEILHELEKVKAACTALHASTNDARYRILLLSLAPRKQLESKLLPEILTKCRPEHVAIAIRETVSTLDFHHRVGLGMTPIEMLLFLHTLLPKAEGEAGSEQHPSMQQVIIALDKCVVEISSIFTESELAKAVQMLCQQQKLSPYLMRTILQAAYAHPSLISLITASILPILVRKKIWEEKDQVLWKGFVKLVIDHQPKTLDILLQLPEKVLLETLTGRTKLLRCFVKYLNQNKMIHGRLLSVLENTFAGIANIY